MSPWLPYEAVLAAQTLQVEPAEITRPTGDYSITRTYTLVGRPSTELQGRIIEVAKILEETDQSPYFYSPAQYHFTVMGDIATDYPEPALIALLLEALAKHSLRPRYEGIQANRRSIFIPAYFPDDALHQLRSELRLKEPSWHDYSTFLEGLDHVAWLNIARFSGPFSPELKQRILSLRHSVFATEDSVSLELYKTSSLVLDPSQSELIYSF